MPPTANAPPDYTNWINQSAKTHNVDPLWVRRIMHMESGGDPNAISRTKNVGLMQVSPELGRSYGFNNLLDPKSNIEAGTRYLGEIMRHYSDPKDILSMYNSGQPWAQGQFKKETWNYVKHFNDTGGLHGPMYTYGVSGGAPPKYSTTPWSMPFQKPAQSQNTNPDVPAPWETPELSWRPPGMDDAMAAASQGTPTPGAMPPGGAPGAATTSLPTPFDPAPTLAEMNALRTQQAGVADPNWDMRTKLMAENAGQSAYSAALPAFDPNDPRWHPTPYQGEAMPTRTLEPLPQEPKLRQDPLATVIGALAGLASPMHAGQFAAAPIQGALQQRQQDWDDAQRQYQLSQQRDDVGYQDAMSGFENRQRLGLTNWEQGNRAAAEMAGAKDQDAVRRAEMLKALATNQSLGLSMMLHRPSEVQAAGVDAQLAGLKDKLDWGPKTYEEQLQQYNAEHRPLEKLQEVYLKGQIAKDRQTTQNEFKTGMAGMTKPLSLPQAYAAMEAGRKMGLTPEETFASVDPSLMPSGFTVPKGPDPTASVFGAINQNRVSQGGLNLQLGNQNLALGGKRLNKLDQDYQAGTLRISRMQQQLKEGDQTLLSHDPAYRTMQNRQYAAQKARDNLLTLISKSKGSDKVLAQRRYKLADDELARENANVDQYISNWKALRPPSPQTPGHGSASGGSTQTAGGGGGGGKSTADKLFNQYMR